MPDISFSPNGEEQLVLIRTVQVVRFFINNQTPRFMFIIIPRKSTSKKASSVASGYWSRRYWYVLKGGYLYCYLTSEDQITVDITQLHGYEVTPRIDQFRGKRFVVHLSHQNYIPTQLSLESRDEMDKWSDALTRAAQLPDGEHVEEVETESTSSPNKGDNNSKLMTIKQKLLAEVLRQKEELEKKQAARRMACQKDVGAVHRRGVGCHDHQSHHGHGDVHVSTVTRLKQRRMSTQIKMEALQRQLGEGIKNGHKKSLFKIGKKKSQEDKNPQLVEQLKELSTTLQEIDINLNSEGVLTRNNVMSSTVGFQKIPTDSDLIQKGDSFEDEQAVYRSNSLKASVQRLAHRTFAKAGWRKNTKKSQSLHFDEYHPDDPQFSPNQEMIDLTTHSADIISSISFSSSAEIMSAAPSNGLSPVGHHQPSSPRLGRITPASAYSPSPPASPASPSVLSYPASPRDIKSSPRDRGLAAARAEMMKRSYSTGGSLSTSSCDTEPSSPRREVNPSIMAEIDAFEELTKQVLSQKSALASH